MKRIGLVILVVALLCCLVETCYGYVPLWYRPYYSFHAGGLVPHDVFYSLYAFSCENPSGLISAYGFNYRSRPSYQDPVKPEKEKSFEEMRRDYEEYLQMRQQRLEKLKQSRTGEEGGKDIICRHLQGRNIEFRLRNGLYIRDRLVACEFLLKNGDIIKYWNVGAITEINQQQESAKIYQKYFDEWSAFKQQYKGGKICEITFLK